MRSVVVLSIALLVAACGDGASEPGPGGVSTEDAKALDEAAAKLEAEASNRQSESNRIAYR